MSQGIGILNVLKGTSGMTIKEISEHFPNKEYDNIKCTVNKLKEDGLIIANGEGEKTYYTLATENDNSDPLMSYVNEEAPKPPTNPDAIEPMPDDEWQKEYNKIVRTRKWVQLPLEQMYSLIEDISDGLISLDDLGEIFIIYCKCIVESRKPTTEDSQNKLILRDVRELMKYDFVQTNEQYAYSVIVNKWHKGDKGVRAKANSHFKELEDRVKGLSDNKRAITTDIER